MGLHHIHHERELLDEDPSIDLETNLPPEDPSIDFKRDLPDEDPEVNYIMRAMHEWEVLPLQHPDHRLSWSMEPL